MRRNVKPRVDSTFAQKARFGLVIDIITAQLGLIRTLRGLTAKFGSFDDGQFDERRFERHLASNPGLALPECWYWIRKLQARFFAGDYAVRPSRHRRGRNGCCGHHHHYLRWRSISFTARCPGPRPAILQRSTSAGSMSRLWPPTIDELEVWAGNCPENFEDSRGAGGRGDRAHRRPAARCRASLRTGHPLGTRKRLRPQ